MERFAVAIAWVYVRYSTYHVYRQRLLKMWRRNPHGLAADQDDGAGECVTWPSPDIAPTAPSRPTVATSTKLPCFITANSETVPLTGK